jgi:hypothetical protein
MSEPIVTNGPSGIEAAANAVLGEQTQAPAEPKPAESEKQGEPAKDDETLREPGKKALEAERERANKAERERNELRARLDAIETANMSELEKAQKQAREAQAKVDQLPQMVSDQLRGYLQGIHDISDEDAALYLTSNDPGTLLRQAVGISERKAVAVPKPDPSQGATDTVALNGDELTQALSRAVGARQ